MNSLFSSKLLIATGPKYKDAGCTENVDVEVDLVPTGDTLVVMSKPELTSQRRSRNSSQRVTAKQSSHVASQPGGKNRVLQRPEYAVLGQDHNRLLQKSRPGLGPKKRLAVPMPELRARNRSHSKPAERSASPRELFGNHIRLKTTTRPTKAMLSCTPWCRQRASAVHVINPSSTHWASVHRFRYGYQYEIAPTLP